MNYQSSTKNERIKRRKHNQELVSSITDIIESRHSIIRDIHGDPVEFLEITRDISKRKEMEKALRTSEAKYKDLFEKMPIGQAHYKIITDADGKPVDYFITEVNPAYERITKLKRSELIGKKATELFPGIETSSVNWIKIFGEVALTGKELSMEVYSDIVDKWFDIIYYCPEPGFIANIFSDITERKRMENSLRENEERFRACLDSMLDCIDIYTAVRDETGEITDFLVDYSNEASCSTRKMTKEELVGKKYFELFYNSNKPESFKKYCELVETGVPLIRESFIYDNKIRKHMWGIYNSTAYKFKDGVVVSWRNITEQKKLEQEIIRLDKLNLVGEMAAGIGHEVRNPLTTVKGFLQLLSTKDECTKFKSYFNLMIEELDRANSIITEFLNVAKDKPIELEVQSLKKIVENLLPLIQSDATVSDKYILMELEEVLEIPLDKREIHQLVINLARNGLESMSPGGTMEIRTFMDKEEIVLEVKDQGKGLAPDVLEKIGTPFFTTKENGTGLGLAVCYSIAARHNAKINIETSSTGTTFLVRFKKV